VTGGIGKVVALCFVLAPTPTLAQSVRGADPEPDPIEAGRASPVERYFGDGIDVLHYDIEVSLPNGAGAIEGWVEIELRATEAVDHVVLDFTGLRIDGVAVDGAPVQGWKLDQGRLDVPFSPAAAGETRTVEISYGGIPDDGLILGETVHGAPSAFVDNWPNRTRFWLPSVDHPSDKATARITVHAPAPWSVIANGREVTPPAPTPAGVPGPDVGPRRTWVYQTDVDQPSYTLVVGGAEMVVDTLGLGACGMAPASPRADGCVAVSTWLFPESVEQGRVSFRRAVEMVDFFSDLVGPFPYEKLAHVQSATRFGGMENSSAIFYSQEGVASGRDMEGTVSHETAHQWFGDSVTEEDWSHLWLSEGFATYFGALFFEHTDGPEALRSRMADAMATYLSSADTARPVIDVRSDLFGLLNTNSYEKGGLVLHMLRRDLGDELFFESVRAYYDRYRDATADTDDFREVVEEVAARDLGIFFRQWLQSPGYPVLSVATAHDGEGLRIDIRQVQGAPSPHFHIPIDVEVQWDEGSFRETVRSTGEMVTIRIPDAPADARVVLDPDGWLLHRRAEGR
jgi:aminopeptidase N